MPAFQLMQIHPQREKKEDIFLRDSSHSVAETTPSLCLDPHGNPSTQIKPSITGFILPTHGFLLAEWVASLFRGRVHELVCSERRFLGKCVHECVCAPRPPSPPHPPPPPRLQIVLVYCLVRSEGIMRRAAATELSRCSTFGSAIIYASMSCKPLQSGCRKWARRAWSGMNMYERKTKKTS